MAFGSESEGSDSVTSLTVTASTGGYCLLQPSVTKKPHTCTYEGCSASFSRPYRLKAHAAKHLGVKPFICGYGGCTKGYTSKMHLKRHIDASHSLNKNSATEEFVYPCSFDGCSEVFKFKQNERRHYRRNHILKTCADCGVNFKKSSQLRTHMSQHTGTPLFCCELCKQRFHTKVDLRRHMRSHKVHFCPAKGCYEAFLTWSAVRKHFRLHPRVLECHYCGKKFRLRKALVMHVNKHLESPFGVIKRKPPPKTVLECATCGLKFTGGKASLRRHVLVQHLGEPSKQKRPRKTGPRATRKDKGIAKRSLAAKLSSVILEPEVEKEIANKDIAQVEPIVSSLMSLCEAIEASEVKEIPYKDM